MIWCTHGPLLRCKSYYALAYMRAYVIRTWHSESTSISWHRRSAARQTAQRGHAPVGPDTHYQTQLDLQ